MKEEGMVFKNRYLIILLCLTILVVNFTIVIKAVKLWYLFIALLLSSPSEVISILNFNLIDILCSVILLIFLLVGSFLFKSPKMLDKKVSLLSISLIVLILFFTIPSLITDTPPEYYNNIKLTKLLEPFSSVYYSRSVDIENKDYLSAFQELKEELLRSNFKSEGTYNKDASFNESNVRRKVFLFGTDEYGRDVASRVIYGTRISFITGILAVSVSLLLGLLLGFMSGYSGGITDLILNRIVEMLLTFPIIFLVILFTALFGGSLFTIILLLGFTGWMTLFKVVRSELILLKKKDFLISSKLLGSSKLMILKEILPAISAPVFLTLIFQFSNVILAESALSYLGLGSGTAYPSWGGMIQEGQSYISRAWWMLLLPGLFLIISLSVTNTIGRKLNTN